MPIVGRLAPSPSGLLHLGHARSFLLAWWYTRSRGGSVVLRIEDLDGARREQRWTDAALRDLEWLGLDWDGAPWIQSEHIGTMEAALEALARAGATYACTCSRGDIRTAQTAPQLGAADVRYPGTCRDRYASAREAEAATGRPAGHRFRLVDGVITVDDVICGRTEHDLQATVGDFLVARRSGAPAYQLAVVVDDAAQGVTEVVRGDDLLSSTARQIVLQRALGLPTPSHAHLPLVLDATGKRFAKRNDALSLAELRDRGVDARAIVAWAARTADHDVGPRASTGDLLSSFDLSRVPRAPVVVTTEVVSSLLDP